MQQRPPGAPPTWLSTAAAAFGIALFFRAASPWYFFAAGALAIGLKYVVRNHSTHIFNPSNIAILLMVFTFTSSTTVEITQWGSNPIFYIAVAAVLVYIAAVAQMIRITVSFLVAYTVLLVGGFQLGLVEIGHHVGLLGPSFMLFISFMLTDPKTAPRTFPEQWVQGPSVAAVYFLLELFGVRYALFVASFLNTALIWLLGQVRAYTQAGILLNTTYPRNAPVALFAYVLLVLVVISAVIQKPPSHISSMSWKYLLFGVEFSSAQACAADPVLQKTVSGVEQPAVTQGAAWGDINGDGVDELFVANVDTPSVLYAYGEDGLFHDHTALSGLPELTASSGFFADIDNDYDQDLLVTALEGDPAIASGSVRVFFNTGRGTFVEDTKALTYTYPTADASLSLADFDNDGFLDVVLATYGKTQRLYPNDSLAFAKAFFDPFRRNQMLFSCNQHTLEALKKPILDFAPTQQRAALEPLLQGKFCILMGLSFSPFSEAITEGTFAQALNKRSFIYMQIMQAGELQLFKGAGTRFTRVKDFSTLTEGLVTDGPGVLTRDAGRAYAMSGHYFQPVSLDYDRDGLMDIFVTTDYGSNVLLRNAGALTFTDVTEAEGLAVTGTGMGAAVGDMNRDGNTDIVVSNIWSDYLFNGTGNVSTSAPRFSFNTDELFGRYGLGWGMGFIDYDSDGWLDLLTVNGDMKDSVVWSEKASIVRPAFRVDTLHRNNEGKFQDVTGVDICTDTSLGRALAFSDVGQDGDTDVFIGSYAHESLPKSGGTFYKNTVMDISGESPNFLAVSLRGSKSNRDGVGALVTVLDSQGQSHTKQLFIGDSFYSQHSKTLLFGLGTAQAVRLSVSWPSGVETVLEQIEPRSRVVVTE
jgi:hypothetical protein